MANGYGAKEIATTIKRNKRTLDNDVDALKQRNNCRTIAQLVAIAVAEQLFTPKPPMLSAAYMRSMADRRQPSQIPKIMEQIERTAGHGGTEMEVNDALTAETVDALREKGFIVSMIFHGTSKGLFKISW